jgi:hypothetical protein
MDPDRIRTSIHLKAWSFFNESKSGTLLLAPSIAGYHKLSLRISVADP